VGRAIGRASRRRSAHKNRRGGSAKAMVGRLAGVRGRVFCVAAFREPVPQLFRFVRSGSHGRQELGARVLNAAAVGALAGRRRRGLGADRGGRAGPKDRPRPRCRFDRGCSAVPTTRGAGTWRPARKVLRFDYRVVVGLPGWLVCVARRARVGFECCHGGHEAAAIRSG
jgi:hypothetical protein